MKNYHAVMILAAGQGTRMHSGLNKMLHPLAGWPLVAHVVELAAKARLSPLVVVVNPENHVAVKQALTDLFPKLTVSFAIQRHPLGTADAVKAGLGALKQTKGTVTILSGDVPLITLQTLRSLHQALPGATLAFLTTVVHDPSHYGRILRDNDRVVGVVEFKDATSDQRQIDEINVGAYCCSLEFLRQSFRAIKPTNAQGEFYLPDIVKLAAQQTGAHAVQLNPPEEFQGINTREELARAEAAMQNRLITAWQNRGVTFTDPRSCVLSKQTQLGRDVTLGPGVQLLGLVQLGEGVTVEGPTLLKNTRIATHSTIKAFCHLEDTIVGRHAQIGPFARLRPGTVLEENVKIGNFVEIKKTKLRRGAKANHLTYLGDSVVGEEANIGAGTITCNYDGGPVKHATMIGAKAFIGSNSTLVAPVRIGQRAYVAAGSTITKLVPNDALSFGRAQQTNKVGYAKRLRAQREKTSKNKGP